VLAKTYIGTNTQNHARQLSSNSHSTESVACMTFHCDIHRQHEINKFIQSSYRATQSDLAHYQPGLSYVAIGGQTQHRLEARANIYLFTRQGSDKVNQCHN
jgi:hypothetical protein